MQFLNILTATILSAVPPIPPEENAAASDLGKILHSMIVPQVPKQMEDRANWGMTIPVPPDLRRTRFTRTLVPVGDRMELPHGGWVRNKVWFDDPKRDIQMRVVTLESLDTKRSRLVLEVTAAVHAERERQQWRNGVRLIGVSVQADAVVTATFEAEVKISLQGKKFPPEVLVEPVIKKTQLDLKSFSLNRVGPVQLFDDARKLGDDLEGFVREQLKSFEPQVTEKLNAAIVKAIQEGKTKLSADTLLKLNLNGMK